MVVFCTIENLASGGQADLIDHLVPNNQQRSQAEIHSQLPQQIFIQTNLQLRK
jgi:hypothetical protein